MSAMIIDIKTKRIGILADQLREIGVGAIPDRAFARRCLEAAILALDEREGSAALHWERVALSDIERWVKSGTSPEDERLALAARHRRIQRASRAADTRRRNNRAREKEIEELREKAGRMV